VAGVWNELDSSGMIFPCLGLLRGRLPAQATATGAGFSVWLPVRIADRAG